MEKTVSGGTTWVQTPAPTINRCIILAVYFSVSSSIKLGWKQYMPHRVYRKVTWVNISKVLRIWNGTAPTSTTVTSWGTAWFRAPRKHHLKLLSRHTDGQAGGDWQRSASPLRTHPGFHSPCCGALAGFSLISKARLPFAVFTSCVLVECSRTFLSVCQEALGPRRHKGPLEALAGPGSLVFGGACRWWLSVGGWGAQRLVLVCTDGAAPGLVACARTGRKAATVDIFLFCFRVLLSRPSARPSLRNRHVSTVSLRLRGGVSG